MDCPVDEQRLRSYQSRINNWIGRQGLLFQLRYFHLRSRGSFWGGLLGFLLALAGVSFVALVVGLVGIKIYQKSGLFVEKLERFVAESLGAEEIRTAGFSRQGGHGNFLRLSLTGGENSFYDQGTILGLRAELPFFAGVVSDWSPESVTIESADFSLKAGGRQREMEQAMAGIMESLGDFPLQRIRITELSCEWGYSKLTFGGFYKTRFDAVRDGEGWVISLKGGHFRQNWIGPFELKEGALRVGPEGIRVDSLVLAVEEGRLELAGRIGGPLEMPTFDLRGTFSRLPVEELFDLEGVKKELFIEGTVSGDLTVTGSTNRKIETEGTVVLKEGDEVLIRDQWRLLRALSAVARDGTYLRVAFGTGSFDFKSGGARCEVTNIDLSADRVGRLTGDFATHLPSQEEAARYLDIKLTDGFSESLTDKLAAQKLEDDRLSIRRRVRGEDEEFGIELDLGIDDEAESSLKERAEELTGLRLQREMSLPRFTGSLRLGVPDGILAENEEVLEAYPADEAGWSWIPVEFSEQRFSDLSEAAAEQLLDLGRLDRPRDHQSGTGN